MNIVIPLAGNLFFDSAEQFYPKPLIEIKGLPIIDRVVTSLKTFASDSRFIFLLKRADDSRFHLRETIRLVTEGKCDFVLTEGPTHGALCSVLLSIGKVDPTQPLVVANGDQAFHTPLNAALMDFQARRLDAGVICFESVHPRWSYVRLDETGKVVEAAEKRPISRNAIAGFYYFAKAGEFMKLAMRHIEKGVEVDGQFFIAPVLNEYVLDDKNVGIYQIETAQISTYYSMQKIEEAQRRDA